MSEIVVNDFKPKTLTVADLIAKKETLKNKKAQTYELETSLGKFLIKPPTAALVADAWQFEKNFESNSYLVLNCVVEPNLKSDELLKAYETVEPLEIVEALFSPGEIARMATAILELGGYTQEKVVTKLHKEIKN